MPTEKRACLLHKSAGGVDMTGRPKETRPVAEGKPGKAATLAGELRPVVNQE